MPKEHPPQPAVIVMGRAPRSGTGKTRLRGVLSDQDGMRLQDAFLRDAVDVALESRVGRVHLAYTPPDAAAWIEDTLGGRIAAFPQERGDLGARMLSALHRVRKNGYAPLIMIGTDAPLLEPRHLRAALSALAQSDLCLGPSIDGGYYLLACQSIHPQLFADVPWGTSRVLEMTLRVAGKLGLGSSVIDELYDVDVPEDLVRLREDLSRLQEEPEFHMPKRTTAFVLSNGPAFEQNEESGDCHYSSARKPATAARKRSS